MACSITAALAGNPNVGKSSLFNRLTGMNQHTGNWTGKTVAAAAGFCRSEGITLVDLPGTYSLRARSAEEEVARDYIKSGDADVIVVVCDASNLERGLPLVLQILELTPRVVVCVNLMDEAKKRGISLDLDALRDALGVPVTAVSARHGDGIDELCRAIHDAADHPPHPTPMRYMPELESELTRLEAAGFIRGDIINAVLDSLPDEYASQILARPIITAEAIAGDAVRGDIGYSPRDRRLDAIITHPILSVPLMLLMLAGIFWLTIRGAAYPSAALESLFADLEAWLYAAASPMPDFIRDPLILGVLHTLLSVVAVMLPPMAIFFPLFTLAEDFGLLGRIAFNLDGVLKRCGACGKQALTMCMSLGCTAVGAIGCRIIDSPRERKLAMLTAPLMPCNGKFPLLLTVCAMLAGDLGALLMTAAILLSVAATFVLSKLLSVTVLRGDASAFTLELPPYRRPQIGRVIIRSILDRTLHVLGRAVIAAAPAGLIIWLLTNLTCSGSPLLAAAAAFFEPAGRLMGLDGVILLSFILGFPANELVLPLMAAGWAAMGITPEWSALTAVNLMLFGLFHFPCATTVLTIAREAGWRTALAAMLLPTALGVVLCVLTHGIFLLL